MISENADTGSAFVTLDQNGVEMSRYLREILHGTGIIYLKFLIFFEII